MNKVLVTGGSGFIATHVLKVLLQNGYNVIATVRSRNKAEKVKEALAGVSSSSLDLRIVEDMAQPGAFDQVLRTEGLEVVIHTASPFQLKVENVKKDLLDPAIEGTNGILVAIKKNAPSVRRVVITSSFAAIIAFDNAANGSPFTYSEKSWNPITEAHALQNPLFGYKASKTFAERAAWDFVEKEKPNFSLTTINPPLVFGPVIINPDSPDDINTSNKTFYDLISGRSKGQVLDRVRYPWVDVRDVALAHMKAFELEGTKEKRLMVAAGLQSKYDLAEIIKRNFPDLAANLPSLDSNQQHTDVLRFDNSLSTEILGPTKFSLEQSVVDTVKSLKDMC
ncbi:Ketoreductase azaE [Golovinomyces cichoracearum]|uniref:Ketoreductase azaE n=1 Tax=Golovinomyces cichoracearum TaxID=62708 RepID=A0A420ITD9_9PEZI|nr:Ketoreductase azaE [Golovinomyces cichoracearum]